MKSFLIIGLGRFGAALAEQLVLTDKEVVGVDISEERAQRMAEQLTHIVIGDAKDEAVLRALGVRNFDCVVVSTTQIEDSIMITLMVKEAGAQHIVAKSRSSLHTKVLQRVGADRVVFPEEDMGRRVAQTLSIDGLIDCIELSEQDSIIELRVPHSWVGHTMIELNIRKKYRVNIIGVRYGGAEEPLHVTIDPAYCFEKEDILIIVGQTKLLKKVCNL